MSRSGEIYSILENNKNALGYNLNKQYFAEYFEYKVEALKLFLNKKDIDPQIMNYKHFIVGSKKYGVYFIPETNEETRTGRNLKMITVGNVSLFVEVLKDEKNEQGSKTDK